MAQLLRSDSADQSSEEFWRQADWVVMNGPVDGAFHTGSSVSARPPAGRRIHFQGAVRMLDQL